MAEPLKLDYAPPARRRNSVIKMLAVTFGMALAFAIIFVVVMTSTLPPTDAAYGQMAFLDPFVLSGAVMGAGVSALLVFPFFYSRFHSSPLRKIVSIIMGITIAELVVVTAINPVAGFLLSFAAFGIGLGVARRVCGPTLPPVDGK